MKTLIIYRCCDSDNGWQRPIWFDKIKCFDSIYNGLDSDCKMIAVHDGDVGPLYNYIKTKTDVDLIKLHYKSNRDSVNYCLGISKFKKDWECIYFVEDDYLHRLGWLTILREGIEKFGLVTLYDHLDRYTSEEDICFGHEQIQITKSSHWRTAESTTCTWACSKYLSDKVIDKAISYLLGDREFFRHLYKNNIRLWQSIPGYSTHCVNLFLSPIIDWEKEG